jgi:hypothetical protein
MRVKRDGQIFNVLEYLPESQEVCVEDEFDFYDKPHERTLKMWWSLKDCEVIENEESSANAPVICALHG